MKKLYFLLVFGLAVSFSVCAARYPNGFGIGAVGSSNFDNVTRGGGALSLKVPKVPVYWAIAVAGSTDSDYISVALSGDVNMFTGTFIKQVNFGYFVQLGGYGRVAFMNDDTGFSGGVRLPIGLKAVFFKNFLEVFIDIAPTLGLGTDNYAHFGSFYFPDWRIPLEAGLRVYF
jgi:hypothetical protein